MMISTVIFKYVKDCNGDDEVFHSKNIQLGLVDRSHKKLSFGPTEKQYSSLYR